MVNRDLRGLLTNAAAGATFCAIAGGAIASGVEDYLQVVPREFYDYSTEVTAGTMALVGGGLGLHLTKDPTSQTQGPDFEPIESLEDDASKWDSWRKGLAYGGAGFVGGYLTGAMTEDFLLNPEPYSLGDRLSDATTVLGTFIGIKASGAGRYIKEGFQNYVVNPVKGFFSRFKPRPGKFEGDFDPSELDSSESSA